jgi:hypothetical protein
MTKIENLNALYGTLHVACELVQAMAGEDGKFKAVTQEQAYEIQKLARRAACESNALTAIGGDK